MDGINNRNPLMGLGGEQPIGVGAVPVDLNELNPQIPKLNVESFKGKTVFQAIQMQAKENGDIADAGDSFKVNKLIGRFPKEGDSNSIIADHYENNEKKLFKFDVTWSASIEKPDGTNHDVTFTQTIYTSVEIPEGSDLQKLQEAKQQAYGVAKSYELLQRNLTKSTTPEPQIKAIKENSLIFFKKETSSLSNHQFTYVSTTSKGVKLDLDLLKKPTKNGVVTNLFESRVQKMAAQKIIMAQGSGNRLAEAERKVQGLDYDSSRIDKADLCKATSSKLEGFSNDFKTVQAKKQDLKRKIEEKRQDPTIKKLVAEYQQVKEGIDATDLENDNLSFEDSYNSLVDQINKKFQLEDKINHAFNDELKAYDENQQQMGSLVNEFESAMNGDGSSFTLKDLNAARKQGDVFYETQLQSLKDSITRQTDEVNKLKESIFKPPLIDINDDYVQDSDEIELELEEDEGFGSLVDDEIELEVLNNPVNDRGTSIKKESVFKKLEGEDVSGYFGMNLAQQNIDVDTKILTDGGFSSFNQLVNNANDRIYEFNVATDDIKAQALANLKISAETMKTAIEQYKARASSNEKMVAEMERVLGELNKVINPVG